MSESSRQPARYGERGGVPRPQDGAPSSTSVDVLAAQVRKAVSVSMMQTGERYVDRDGIPAALYTHDEYDEAMAALSALVARVTAAERRAEYWNAATKATAGEYQSSRTALADARNALEGVEERTHWDYACTAREAMTLMRGYVREVLARLDGNQP